MILKKHSSIMRHLRKHVLLADASIGSIARLIEEYYGSLQPARIEQRPPGISLEGVVHVTVIFAPQARGLRSQFLRPSAYP